MRDQRVDQKHGAPVMLGNVVVHGEQFSQLTLLFVVILKSC